MPCANPAVETMPRTDLERLQLERLKKSILWASEKSKFYSEHLKDKETGSVPSIDALSDIEKLPFTTLEDLLGCSAFDFVTMPLSGVMRISREHDPMEMYKMYSKDDVGHNVEMMSRALAASGVNRATIVGVLGDYSDSQILDVHYALEILGATVVPLGIVIENALALMEFSGVDTIIGTSQDLMQVIIQSQVRSMDITEYPISRVICMNGSIQNPMKRHFGDRMKADVWDLYASEELGFAGAFYACDGGGKGNHVQEDNFYVEVVEFGGDEPVREDAKMGEMVITTLNAQAMPLIRYRTGQAVMRISDPCPCGRTFMRIMTPFGA